MTNASLIAAYIEGAHPDVFEEAVAAIDDMCNSAQKRIREANSAIAARDLRAYQRAAERADYDLRCARETLGDIA